MANTVYLTSIFLLFDSMLSLKYTQILYTVYYYSDMF